MRRITLPNLDVSHAVGPIRTDGVQVYAKDGTLKAELQGGSEVELADLDSPLAAGTFSSATLVVNSKGRISSVSSSTPDTSTSIKAIRAAYASSHTHSGATDQNDGAQSIKTSSTVTLDASTTYVLEWNVNLAEDSGGAAGQMEADVQFSTDDVTYTTMHQAYQYEGSSDTGIRSYDISFIHTLTTNSTGGTYYFQFDTNEADVWIVHDFQLKVIECSDVAGLNGHTQAE